MEWVPDFMRCDTEAAGAEWSANKRNTEQIGIWQRERTSGMMSIVAELHGWKYRRQKIAKKSPSGYHRTTLSGYIFAITKACTDNRKKMLNSNISSRFFHTVNFGPLTAEIFWRVWDTRTFHPVSRLGFVTAPTSLNGGQQNFAGCLAVSWLVHHIYINY